MKLKIGSGLNDITLLDRNGDLLIGRDETGEWINRLTLTQATLRLGPQEFPTLDLSIALYGYEIELDVKEEEITALLERIGITKIEGRKEDADIHTDS